MDETPKIIVSKLITNINDIRENYPHWDDDACNYLLDLLNMVQNYDRINELEGEYNSINEIYNKYYKLGINKEIFILENGGVIRCKLRYGSVYNIGTITFNNVYFEELAVHKINIIKADLEQKTQNSYEIELRKKNIKNANQL